MIIMVLQEDSSHLFFEKRISLTELKCFDHELRVFPLTIDPSSVYFVFVKLRKCCRQYFCEDHSQLTPFCKFASVQSARGRDKEIKR